LELVSVRSPALVPRSTHSVNLLQSFLMLMQYAQYIRGCNVKYNNKNGHFNVVV